MSEVYFRANLYSVHVVHQMNLLRAFVILAIIISYLTFKAHLILF